MFFLNRSQSIIGTIAFLLLFNKLLAAAAESISNSTNQSSQYSNFSTSAPTDSLPEWVNMRTFFIAVLCCCLYCSCVIGTSLKHAEKTDSYGFENGYYYKNPNNQQQDKNGASIDMSSDMSSAQISPIIPLSSEGSINSADENNNNNKQVSP